MKAKTLLLVAAFVVAGMIPAKAQSNPGSTNGTDVEMELTWPDGQAYSTSLQSLWNYIALKSAVNGKINLHDDYTWSETGGGSGSAIDQVDIHPYWSLSDDDFVWPGGRWPELGVGVDTYIPNGSTNVSYPPSAGYDRFYFGSQSFQSSDGNLTIQNQDQPEFMMLTGGAPGATGNELYSISGSAYTYFYTDKSLPDANATVVPPNQIQIGNLGSLDTNGVLYASLPVHSALPVTPHVNLSGYHGGHFYTTAYPLVSQCVATTPTNPTRTTIGVGEQVNLNFSPTPSLPASSFVWSTTGGSLSYTNGNSNFFTAPGNAANVTVTVKVRGQPITKTFTVIEPSTETSTIRSNDTFNAGVEGAGMQLIITWGPTNVSFSRVQIMEVPGPAINITGYFTNFSAANLAHNPDQRWITLSSLNQTGDHASISGYSSPWYPGGFDWSIPVIWRIVGGNVTNNFPHNELQTFRITDTLGTTTVSKLGSSVTRTP